MMDSDKATMEEVKVSIQKQSKPQAVQVEATTEEQVVVGEEAVADLALCIRSNRRMLQWQVDR